MILAILVSSIISANTEGDVGIVATGVGSQWVQPGGGAGLGVSIGAHITVRQVDLTVNAAVSRIDFAAAGVQTLGTELGFGAQFSEGLFRPFAGIFLSALWGLSRMAILSRLTADSGTLFLGEEIGVELVPHDLFWLPLLRIGVAARVQQSIGAQTAWIFGGALTLKIPFYIDDPD